jgi:uncharacterized protein
VPGASSAALPPRGGIGLKPAHFAELLDSSGRGAGPYWVEVHPQNYMMAGGPMHRWLTAVADSLPLSFHSVGLSIGDPDGPDADELDRLEVLVERYEPAMVSDHLSWSSLSGTRIPDLLPVPMTKGLLDHFVAGVGRIQDRLKRPILIENPSRMLAFASDEYEEPDFLAQLCRTSGCGLLLDINNVIVSAANLGFDAGQWLDSIDSALVGEIHVAGHSIVEHEPGIALRIDDHGSPVGEQCWSLLERFLKRSGPRPVLVERDNNLPPFAELAAEAARADRLIAMEMADAA